MRKSPLYRLLGDEKAVPADGGTVESYSLLRRTVPRADKHNLCDSRAKSAKSDGMTGKLPREL